MSIVCVCSSVLYEIFIKKHFTVSLKVGLQNNGTAVSQIVLASHFRSRLRLKPVTVQCLYLREGLIIMTKNLRSLPKFKHFLTNRGIYFMNLLLTWRKYLYLICFAKFARVHYFYGLHWILYFFCFLTQKESICLCIVAPDRMNRLWFNYNFFIWIFNFTESRVS